MTDNEAGRMLSSGHEMNELSAAIRGIRDSVMKLSCSTNQRCTSTENRNSENTHLPEGNYSYNSQSIPTQGFSESVPYVDTVPPTLRSNILQGKEINLVSLIMPQAVE